MTMCTSYRLFQSNFMVINSLSKKLLHNCSASEKTFLFDWRLEFLFFNPSPTNHFVFSLSSLSITHYIFTAHWISSFTWKHVGWWTQDELRMPFHVDFVFPSLPSERVWRPSGHSCCPIPECCCCGERTGGVRRACKWRRGGWGGRTLCQCHGVNGRHWYVMQ